MNNPIALIGNSVLQLVGGNVYLFLFIILSLGVVLWLYKELRKEDSERVGKVLERLDKTLETLGKLESSLLHYLDSTKDQDAKKLMYDMIGSAYPYVQVSLIEKIQGIFSEPSSEYGEECVKEIRREIKILKRYNDDAVPKLADGEMSSLFERSIVMITTRFFKPAFVASLILIVMYCVMAVIFMSGSGAFSTAQVWELVLFIIALYFLVMFAAQMLTLIADGKGKQYFRLDGPWLLYPPLLGVIFTGGITARVISFALFFCVVLLFILREKHPPK